MKVFKENLIDFISNAEIIFVDDARAFDINKWELENEEEISEEIGSNKPDVIKPKFIKYKLDQAAIDKIIDKLATSDISITDYWKTKQFLKKHNFTKEDLYEVIRNIKSEDYVTNSKADNYNEASIFIKNSKIKELGPFNLYIKLDYDSIEEVPVIVISIHETR